MIRRLQIKLVAAAMVSLFVVLGVILAIANALNYRGVVAGADEVLALLAENGGAFPDQLEEPPDGPRGESGGWQGERQAGQQGDRRDRRLSGRLASPELPFESRYFSVLFDADGAVCRVDTGMIAAVDKTRAEAYARAVYDSGASAGFAGDYRFARARTGEDTLVVFLDCGRSLSSFRSFLLTGCAIAALGLLSVFLLLAPLSARIVRPVSESYEKQKRFITDAGHELKTPLAIIEADADALEMDAGASEWLDDIRAQTARLAELTKSLVSLSRMEEDAGQFRMIDFPVSDVVSEAAQSFQAPARVQGKAFSLAVQPMLTLRGDEKAIRQLTAILLDNALKYSPEGGRVELTLEKQGRGVRMCVFNTAERVDGKNLDRLFDRFYRADASRNSSTGGYGIGLSIARAIVSAHRGKIAASTKDGQSLLMTVTLPG